MIGRDFSRMHIYMQLGATDMRKSICTLSILVQENMRLDPFSESIFMFCNKRKNLLKILYWDKNGFCLWHKRLEKDKFKWPKRKEQIMELKYQQLLWFLNGLDFSAAYESLDYKSVL